MQDFASQRESMIQEQLIRRGIKDPAVLEAFRHIPRELFVPQDELAYAYADHPLNIGYGQTISQPYIVAYMLEALGAVKGHTVLEVGTGSGYQTAFLRSLGGKVFTMERIPLLAHRAMYTLFRLGLEVNLKVGDGTQGWQEYAPYDRIIVSAASPAINESLYGQLKVNGTMIIPVGGILGQELVRVIKKSGGDRIEEPLTGCVFVPLIGKYGFSH